MPDHIVETLPTINPAGVGACRTADASSVADVAIARLGESALVREHDGLGTVA